MGWKNTGVGVSEVKVILMLTVYLKEVSTHPANKM